MNDADRSMWLGMLSHLRANHPALCRQWFEELEPLGVASGALQLRAQSLLHRDYLRRQCTEPFNDAARAVSGRLLAVRFLGPDDPVERAIENARQRPDRTKPPIFDHATPPTPPAAPPSSSPAARASAPPPPATSPAPPSPAAVPAIPSPATDAPATLSHAPAALPTAAAGVNHAAPARTPDQALSRPRLDPSGYESLVINPDFCFENFVEGPGNRLALAAARAVADKPGKAYNPLFLHGGVGLGKTHLLQAICVRILESNPGARLFYTSCEGFVTRFMECVASGGMIEFRHTFRDVDVLVIDDIHFLATRERTQEEFFHTFNTLYHASKQIILSSDAAPEEIPQLEDRLVSRFMWGLVAKVDPPDYETRIAILKSKARIRGLSLADDVAAFVARRVDTNIRELEGAIVKLQIQSTVENRPIDLDLARAALGEARATGAEPSLQVITTAVTEFYRVRLPDLQSKSRHRSVTLPRQVAMFLARRLTRHSLEEIGGFFGGRDHTTVMHAIRTVDDRKGLDQDFDAVLRALEDKIRLGRSL